MIFNSQGTPAPHNVYVVNIKQARAGLSSTVDVLKVAQAYKNETNYTVWSDLASNLSNISVLSQYTDFNDLFLKYQVQLFSGVADRLGWDKRDAESELLTKSTHPKT